MTEPKAKDTDPSDIGPASSESFGPPVLNEDRYRSMVDKFDMDAAAKSELLQLVWNMLVSVHDLGLGIDPIQTLFADSAESSTNTPADPVCLVSDTPTHQFKHAASEARSVADKES